jgi:hypothetical protein
MKKLSLILLLSLLSLGAVHILKLRAAEPSTFQVSEFATIRWAGRDNTYLIHPNGKVDKLKILFERFPRPEGGIDERAYYMSIAMNAVAKEGFEFAGMTGDEIVMKRPVAR